MGLLAADCVSHCEIAQRLSGEPADSDRVATASREVGHAGAGPGPLAGSSLHGPPRSDITETPDNTGTAHDHAKTTA